MLIEQLSQALTKALPLNSQSVAYSLDVQARATDPAIDSFGNVVDGVFDAGSETTGSTAPRLCVLPYAQGAPQAEFWLRVIGWRLLRSTPTAQDGLWLPAILAELWVQLGTAQGVDGTKILGSEYFAGAIVLRSGVARVYGPAGERDAAYAIIPLQGCQKFQFDFAFGDEVPAFGNALWAKA